METANVANNDDRAFLDRFKECLERYEAICAAQQAIEAELIDSCDDYEVYNKKGADGKIKKLHEVKPPYIYVKPKKGFAKAMTTYQWGNNKTTKSV